MTLVMNTGLVVIFAVDDEGLVLRKLLQVGRSAGGFFEDPCGHRRRGWKDGNNNWHEGYWNGDRWIEAWWDGDRWIPGVRVYKYIPAPWSGEPEYGQAGTFSHKGRRYQGFYDGNNWWSGYWDGCMWIYSWWNGSRWVGGIPSGW